MRLINSDGQIVDAKVQATENSSANRNSFHVDIGAFAIAGALLIALLTIVISVWSAGLARNAAESAQRSEKESRLTQYYLMDPHSRTPEELASWAKFNKEHEEK